jgi:hypothetical protein
MHGSRTTVRARDAVLLRLSRRNCSSLGQNKLIEYPPLVLSSEEFELLTKRMLDAESSGVAGLSLEPRGNHHRLTHHEGSFYTQSVGTPQALSGVYSARARRCEDR